MVVAGAVAGGGTILFGGAEIMEGSQNIYYGATGDMQSSAFNPIRDTVFLGNQGVYDFTKNAFVFAAGAMIPIGSAYSAGTLTLRSGSVIVAEELLSEGSGFLVSNAGEALDLNPTATMLLSIAASMGTSAGLGKLDQAYNVSGSFPKIDVTAPNPASMINDVDAPPASSGVDVPGSSSIDDIITDGSQLENGKLKPNVKYQTGEYDYTYQTDANGRISNWSTDDLKLTARSERLPHDSVTPGKLDGDHAGHLAGDRFGGSPAIDNIVSQSKNVNLSQYKRIENQWAKAIEDGKDVSVNVSIKYAGDSLRPVEFNVEYTIDGKYICKDIIN